MGILNRTQRRRSADEWRALIAEQQQSGLSQRAFCQQKGLVLSSFCNWKRRLTGTPLGTTPAEDDWLELPVSLPRSSDEGHWDIELDLGNGLCLRLHKR